MSTKVVFRGGPADGLTTETFHKVKSLPPTMLPPGTKLLPGGLYVKGDVSADPVTYVWREVKTSR